MLRSLLTCFIAAVAALLLAAGPGPTATSGAAAPATGAIRWAYYVPNDPSSLASLKQRSGDLDYVGLHWASMKEDGSIAMRASADVIKLVRSIGARPLLSVALYGDAARAAHALLGTDGARTATVNALASALSDYDGISIDFEGMDPQDRDSFTRFQAELAARLRPAGKLVTMALSAKSYDIRVGWAGAHDYAALAPHADLFVIMTYGYRTSNSSVPGSPAPIAWVTSCISYAVSAIPREKVLLGVPLYGYDWNLTAGPPGVALRQPDAVAIAARQGVAVEYDSKQQAARFAYVKDGGNHEVWFEDRSTLEAKLPLVAQHSLAGVAAWRLGHEDPQVWQSINALRQGGVPQSAPPVQQLLQPVPTAQPAPQPTPIPVVQEPPHFKLGFKVIADQIADIVGHPVENEHFSVRDGNSIQHTVNPNRLTPAGLPREGLMVWRKSDNWTAFTDGYNTWVNGPYGLQQRLNIDRFPWENDPIAQPGEQPQR